MTKLEAWREWCVSTGAGDRLANQFALENSSHGKAFSFAWDAAHEACAKVCEEIKGVKLQGYEFAATIRART